MKKRELRSYAHENQELWSRSHVNEKKIYGAGAVSFLRRLRNPGFWLADLESESKTSHRMKFSQWMLLNKNFGREMHI